MSLAERRCVPCEKGTPPLAPDAVRALAAELPEGWTVEDTQLRKTYRVKGWLGAVALVNAITPIAEAEGHHPDLRVSWGRVGVELTTHAIGGLSENDFILAAKIEREFDRLVESNT
jgi:4a-hydroxytetrahydrobiopterin dehydratase